MAALFFGEPVLTPRHCEDPLARNDGFIHLRWRASFRVPETSNVHHRPCRQSERSACARRTIQRLAVRAGEGDCRAAEENTEGRGLVRARLWTVRPPPYPHFWRIPPFHHGPPHLPPPAL